MALMIDGKLSTVADILRHDSGCLEVSEAEAISIDDKLALADRDCRLKLSQFVVIQGLEDVLGMAGNLLRLERIITNEAMERWHEFHTLSLLYSDAYFRSLGDRYEKKLEHYETTAKAAWETLVDTGIECTLDPVARASVAEVEVVAGSIAQAATYYVAIRWVNANGRRGDLSERHVVNAEVGTGIQITPGESPDEVTGYDVFAGPNAEDMRKQNNQPELPGTPYVITTVQSTGEQASAWSEPVDFLLRRKRRLLRG